LHSRKSFRSRAVIALTDAGVPDGHWISIRIVLSVERTSSVRIVRDLAGVRLHLNEFAKPPHRNTIDFLQYRKRGHDDIGQG
jgi:hypothetical protein